MRKATTVLVGLAGIVTVGASWATGLAPKHTAVTGVHILSSAKAGTPVAAAPPKPSSSAKSSKAPSGSTTSRGSTSGTTSKAAPAAPRSGTVDGAVVGTQYGSVQVRVSFTGTKITNVHALQLTDSSRTSVSISAGAAPTLRREALAAQSAQIDVVSGATYTSEAYQQSLQSAIDAAHLG
ncbi:FMN-binding protein [Terracoccus sp. 273MFTsu3.1]|uniref:FMN-binding protein n=1 Tax=Terracoccus sp. 273MFTsu3.1 TaxID=1172188 RepID=UPI00035C6626|nr:FMN-binding protein [Terracoccus sp. 273MFTsu3.1]